MSVYSYSSVIERTKEKAKTPEAAFKEFLGSLPITNPKELILINPQLVPEDVFDVETARRKGYFAYPPVGLLYLAAIAREVNPQIDLQVIDLNYELLRYCQSDDFTYDCWKEIVREAIARCNAPYVVITYMFGSTKKAYVEISQFVRENFPQIPIISGGVQASYDFKEILGAGHCDIVFRKEGELQFKSFLESSKVGEAVATPWGAAFRHEGQIYELGAPQTGVLDWNQDIRPYYDLIDIKSYNQYGSMTSFSRYNGEEKSFATVLSNRGCRAMCAFCTVRDFNGAGVRQRSVDSVVEEIKYLVREKGIQQIDWLDDDLLFNPDRALEMFKRLAEEVPELEWICNNGLIAVAVTEELMYWMVKSGMKAFRVGIESGNAEVLKQIRKPTTKSGLLRRTKIFKKYPEVFLNGNFILGFAGETFSQMMETYNFAIELAWDWASFHICQPLKGTSMFSAFQQLGDDRCHEEDYGKTFNPGRGKLLEGKFGNDEIMTGKDIFKLPYDVVPSQEQVREIWFTFNFMVNFVENVNLKPGGNVTKIVKWYEAILGGYPSDASMCAVLVKAYRMLGNDEMAELYQQKFKNLVANSGYWQRRIVEFPELPALAGVGRTS